MVLSTRALKEAVKEWLDDRQKISILVELTVCQKNVASTLNLCGYYIENRVCVCNISIGSDFRMEQL